MDPLQIAEHWGAISKTMGASLPPDTNVERFVSPEVFQELLAGIMDAWAIERSDGAVCCMATTRWIVDALSSEKRLTIFSLFGNVPPPVLHTAFKTLTAFAKANGGTRIVAYTNNPAVVGLASNLGADTSWRFLNWEV